MLKLGCANQFLQEICQRNNIITTEQAGGKKDVWEYFVQLLINNILKDLTENRLSLITIRLD